MEDGLFGLFGLAWTLAFGVAALAHVRAAFAKENVALRLVVLASMLEAEERKHPRVTLLHFVLALSCDPDVAARLARMGVGNDLRDRLDVALGREEGGEGQTRLSRAADPTIGRIGARARRRRRRSPSPAQYMTTLVDALANDRELAPDLKEIFDAVGITKSAWSASAAPRAAGEASPIASPYRGAEEPRADRVVRLWNDDKTTQALVVELLTGTFGRSPSEARYLMLRTHHLGSAAFGDFTSHDADRLVTSATTHARERGSPLAITIEPASAPSKSGFFAALLGR